MNLGAEEEEEDPGPPIEFISKSQNQTEDAATRVARAAASKGFRAAKEIGRLGIGQTVVVKNRVVVAVEAVEGTDAAIQRGGTLARSGCVVVKVSKPQQDLRFDVPAVGIDTVENLHKAGGTVLAVEAGKTILLQKESFLRQADDYGISVVGVSD